MRTLGGSWVASVASMLAVIGLVTGCCCPRSCDPCCGRVDGSRVTPSGRAGPDPAPFPAAPKPLFERLGGIPAITAATDDFLPRLFANPTVMGNAVVRERLMKADAAAVRQRLIDQLCNLTGGPCAYTGKDMRTAHTGLGITAAEWDAALTEFGTALDHVKVPPRERGELVAIIQAMRTDIVGR